MSNLNPKQFWYHASKRNLTPGVDQILPANDPRVGGSNYGYSKHDNWASGGWDEPDGSSRGDFTFAADTEEEAEAWTPSSHGRAVTYVVDPGQDWEEEPQHVMTEGVHAKVRGPMNIVDRIDIPKPGQPDGREVVQGTLPPENWARHSKTYDKGANAKRIFPAYERMQAEARADKEPSPEYERTLSEAKWKAAGQLHLFHGPTATGRIVNMTDRYS